MYCFLYLSLFFYIFLFHAKRTKSNLKIYSMYLISFILYFIFCCSSVRAEGERRIDYVIIHCSAVRPGQTSSARQIDQWHRSRGWRMIGYHYVVRRDGTIEQGRPLWMVGAHCKGQNAHSIGICYEGGLDGRGRPCDTRTRDQKVAMERLIKELHTNFPNAKLVGHNRFAKKACPCYNP